MSEHSPGTGLLDFSKFDEQWGVPVFKAIVGELDTVAHTGDVDDVTLMMAYVKLLVEECNHLNDMAMHETYIFPGVTNLTCTLTAHTNANEWSSWAEVVDSAAASLSTLFAATAGHLTAMICHSANQDDTDYMVQVAYGSAKTHISSWRIHSQTNKLSSSGQSSIRSVHIPAGETIYARVMCATAAAKTLLVHFRYFLH